MPTATYLDSSVLLAEVFLEPKRPAPGFWRRHLLSSRLLEYEARTRLNAKALPLPVMKAALELIETVELREMSPEVLARARDPWPVAIRTLDACTSRPSSTSAGLAPTSTSPPTIIA